MEGLPFDSGAEDDSDSKKKDSKKSKERVVGKELVDLVGLKDKAPKAEASQEKQQPIEKLNSDKTPELDTEAPVEHLSQVESEAIAQTLAGQHLQQIRNQEPATTPEQIATENFLENLEVSGDVQQAFQQTLTELGIDNKKAEEAVAKEQESEPEPEPLPTRATPLRPVSSPNSSRTNRRSEEQPSETNPLLGSIVSYLMARRTARLKNENKTAPLKQRLETEVRHLETQIVSRENSVKTLVIETASLVIPERSLATTITAEETRQELNIDKAAPRPESIGKVLVDSELPHAEVRPENIPDGELSNLKAQTMNRAELLRVAQKIMIDGSSLRQIYETHLVGEKGMRRIIAVYLRGGNVKRALRRELIQREIDFERDPDLRDQGSTKPVDAATTLSQFDNLLKKSGIDWAENQDVIPITTEDGSNLIVINNSKQPANPLRKVMDLLFIAIILTLAAIIIVLILK
jgi:hypothetical protein